MVEVVLKGILVLLFLAWGVLRLVTGTLLLFQHDRLMQATEHLQPTLEGTFANAKPASRWERVIAGYAWYWLQRPSRVNRGLVTNPVAARVVGVISLLIGVFLVLVVFYGLVDIIG